MQFRLARHTEDLQKVREFYVNILGFEVLGEFHDHDNYDGIFIGKSNENWHLEFTSSDELPNHRFDEDDALVFYPKSQTEFDEILARIQNHKIQTYPAKNPYWNNVGAVLIKDFDEHVIIFSPQRFEF